MRDQFGLMRVSLGEDDGKTKVCLEVWNLDTDKLPDLRKLDADSADMLVVVSGRSKEECLSNLAKLVPLLDSDELTHQIAHSNPDDFFSVS